MVAKRKLTVDDVLAMSESGIFAPDERIELIDGELYTTTPSSSQHAGHLKWLIIQLESIPRSRAIPSIQDPLTLNEHRLLEPDIALLYPKDSFYIDTHPTAEDTLLAVEISLSSLAFDKEKKLPAYAEAGVNELWIVDVANGLAEVYWEPDGNRYRHSLTVRRGEKVAPRAFPEIEIVVLPPL